MYNSAENLSLEQKLHWYRDHRHTVLPLNDRHLANIDSDEIKRMGRRTRRKWVQHFDRLSDIHKKETQLWDEGQSAITMHFKVIEHKKCSRIAGTRKPRQPQKMKKRLTQSTLDSTLALTKQKRDTRHHDNDRPVPRGTIGVQTRIKFTAGTAQPQRKDRPRPPEDTEPD